MGRSRVDIVRRRRRSRNKLLVEERRIGKRLLIVISAFERVGEHKKTPGRVHESEREILTNRRLPAI